MMLTESLAQKTLLSTPTAIYSTSMKLLNTRISLTTCQQANKTAKTVLKTAQKSLMMIIRILQRILAKQLIKSANRQAPKAHRLLKNAGISLISSTSTGFSFSSTNYLVADAIQQIIYQISRYQSLKSQNNLTPTVFKSYLVSFQVSFSLRSISTFSSTAKFMSSNISLQPSCLSVMSYETIASKSKVFTFGTNPHSSQNISKRSLANIEEILNKEEANSLTIENKHFRIFIQQSQAFLPTISTIFQRNTPRCLIICNKQVTTPDSRISSLKCLNALKTKSMIYKMIASNNPSTSRHVDNRVDGICISSFKASITPENSSQKKALPSLMTKGDSEPSYFNLTQMFLDNVATVAIGAAPLMAICIHS